MCYRFELGKTYKSASAFNGMYGPENTGENICISGVLF